MRNAAFQGDIVAWMLSVLGLVDNAIGPLANTTDLFEALGNAKAGAIRQGCATCNRRIVDISFINIRAILTPTGSSRLLLLGC